MSELKYKEVVSKPFVRSYISKVCGDGRLDHIVRPACYMIRSEEEGEREVDRIIILPPNGYTADKLNMMNSHDEAEYASIEIRGAVREGKAGFSKIRNCLLIASYYERGNVSELNKPYLTFTLNDSPMSGFSKDIRSAGEPPFAVVRSDGFGFYHNLINISDDWLTLKLYKKVRPQRKPDLEKALKDFPVEYQSLLNSLYANILSDGDGIFKSCLELIDKVSNLPLEYSIPALTEMLYIFDTGKHEACSVFAVILKIGNKHPKEVVEFMERAVAEGNVPKYYADQLIKKIGKQKILVAANTA